MNQADGRDDAIVIHVDPRMEDLVSAYLERCRTDVQTIPSLLSGDDLEAIRALGDRMAGSGGAYGFSDVSTLGFEIERAARVSDHAAIGEAVAGLVRYLESVKIVRSS
ncbi:MAG: Hpt domain-containing protein [Gemmatimonadota bacterium]|nr:Hpt domain-containing protein [Gemmatimonadota bacterium]